MASQTTATMIDVGRRLQGAEVLLKSPPERRSREPTRRLVHDLETIALDLAVVLADAPASWQSGQDGSIARDGIGVLDRELGWVERHAQEVPPGELWPALDRAYDGALAALTALQRSAQANPTHPRTIRETKRPTGGDTADREPDPQPTTA